jgi:hypothetical protein
MQRHALADSLIAGLHLVHGCAARQGGENEYDQQVPHDFSSST